MSKAHKKDLSVMYPIKRRKRDGFNTVSNQVHMETRREPLNKEQGRNLSRNATGEVGSVRVVVVVVVSSMRFVHPMIAIVVVVIVVI